MLSFALRSPCIDRNWYVRIGRIVICASLWAMLSFARTPAAHAACGDWLQPAATDIFDSRRHDADPPQRPCQGKSCRQVPNDSPTSAPISVPVQQYDDRIVGQPTVEKIPCDRAAHRDLSAAAKSADGYAPSIERPPRDV